MKLRITGLSCEHCVRAVTNALLSVPGVTGAKVSLKEGIALVEGKADPEALVKAVEKEGYGAELLSS